MCDLAVQSAISFPACHPALSDLHLGRNGCTRSSTTAFRIMARRDANDVRLYTRNGYDFAGCFPQIVEAVSKLKVRSYLSTARLSWSTGTASQPLTCFAPSDTTTPPCSVDLIEVDGRHLRRVPIEQRKQALAGLLRRERDGIVLNVHYDCDGETVFEHACRALSANGLARPIARAAISLSSSPNPRDQPPSYPLRIVAIARQLLLQHAVLANHAIQKKWHTDRDEKCGRDP